MNITPFLWYDGQAAEAQAFYLSVFPDSSEGEPGGPGYAVHLPGLDLLLFDGGPHFTFNEAISLFVSVETQDEVDHLWEALAEGGQHIQCGWLKDRFGVAWQIVPTALGRLLADPDPEVAGRVHAAMMQMKRLVIADLEAAAAGGDPVL